MQTKKRFKSMKTKRNDYLVAWEKEAGQVRDPELRQVGEARRSDVKANLDRVVESLTVANETFDPFLNNLGDVQKVLGNDLTPAGQSLVHGGSDVLDRRDKVALRRGSDRLPSLPASVGVEARPLTPAEVP